MLLTFEELIDIYGYKISINYKMLNIERYNDNDDIEFMEEDIYTLLKLKLNENNIYLAKVFIYKYMKNNIYYYIIPNKKMSQHEYICILKEFRNMPNNIYSLTRDYINYNSKL